MHLNLSPCCIHRVFLAYLIVLPRLGVLGGLINGEAYIRITGIEKGSRDELALLIKITFSFTGVKTLSFKTS